MVAPATQAPAFVRSYPRYDYWTVPSASTPGELHTVLVFTTGETQCSCANAVLGHRTCRHICAVVAALREAYHAVQPE